MDWRTVKGVGSRERNLLNVRLCQKRAYLGQERVLCVIVMIVGRIP